MKSMVQSNIRQNDDHSKSDEKMKQDNNVSHKSQEIVIANCYVDNGGLDKMEEPNDSEIEQMYVNHNDITEQPTKTITKNEQFEGENPNKYSEENKYKWIEETLKKCDDKDWEIYLSNFKKEKWTDDRLKRITEDIWTILIPESGVRLEFQELWKQKQSNKNNKSFNDEQNV